jgi:hypothetical protein
VIGWAAVRRAADRAVKEPEPEPEPDECLELEREVSQFLDDPITSYYGVGGEMMPLVRSSHRRRHGCGAPKS